MATLTPGWWARTLERLLGPDPAATAHVVLDMQGVRRADGSLPPELPSFPAPPPAPPPSPAPLAAGLAAMCAEWKDRAAALRQGAAEFPGLAEAHALEAEATCLEVCAGLVAAHLQAAAPARHAGMRTDDFIDALRAAAAEDDAGKALAALHLIAIALGTDRATMAAQTIGEVGDLCVDEIGRRPVLPLQARAWGQTVPFTDGRAELRPPMGTLTGWVEITDSGDPPMHLLTVEIARLPSSPRRVVIDLDHLQTWRR